MLAPFHSPRRRWEAGSGAVFDLSTNGRRPEGWTSADAAGSRAGALPMGARLRLKASKDISRYPTYIRAMFRAMQTYGLIVADNGSDMYITGTMVGRCRNGR